MSCSGFGCQSISTTWLLRPAATPVGLRGIERLRVIVTARDAPEIPNWSKAWAPMLYVPSSTVWELSGCVASLAGPIGQVKCQLVPLPEASPWGSPSRDHVTLAGVTLVVAVKFTMLGAPARIFVPPLSGWRLVTAGPAALPGLAITVVDLAPGPFQATCTTTRL